MSKVKRVYVEKKQPFAVTAKELTEDIKGYLEIDALKDVRVLVRYDVENISDETYNRALTSVFSEPPVDNVYEETFPYDADNSKVFSVEFLPGQFDQRADSAVQCVKFLNEDEEPVIKTATTYVLEGNISDEEFEQIKNYCINPVDSRETGLQKPETLVKLSEIGVKIPELVIGGTVKPAEGEEAVKLSQRAYAKPDDIEAYKKLKAAGTKLYAQYVPADAEVSIDEFLK